MSNILSTQFRDVSDPSIRDPIADYERDTDQFADRWAGSHTPARDPNGDFLEAILDGIVARLNRHLVLPVGAADAIALWIVHAHALDAARHSPILALLSPQRRCGKTTALDLIRELVPAALATANITTAALYRGIEEMKPTLLVDEADTFLSRDLAMVGVLNAGHARTSAFVIRAAQDVGIKIHSVWCPKVMAAIGQLPTSLADRAITILLRRRRRDEKIERLGSNEDDRLTALRDVIANRVSSDLAALKETKPYIPEGLNDRAADNWRPLLAIAEAAGGEWPERGRRAALALSSASNDRDETEGSLLLSDIREIFAEKESDQLKSAEIVARLVQMEHRPWPEWRRGRPITPVQVASILNLYGIRPETHRFGSETAKGYLLLQFSDAFNRYVEA